MISSQTQARDEIMALLKAVADAQSLLVIYDDTQADKPESGSWARARLQHIDSQQGSLSREDGKSRYEERGFLFIEVYTDFGDGLGVNDTLTAIIKDGYRGETTIGGVWFRNVRSREEGQSDNWFKTVITVEFLYDVIK